MRIEVHLYELHSLNALNVHFSTPTKHAGALLKVQFDEQSIGFADCHPWPELGDEPLVRQLDQLMQGKLTPLTSCSIDWAQKDAIDRHLQKKCVKKEAIPLSHFLITDLNDWSLEKTQQLVKQKFTHVKVKVGRSFDQEIAQLFSCFQDRFLKIRLDFNEHLSYSECQSFLTALQPLQSQIDFIEDPCPFDAYQWSQIQHQGWKLACDRHVYQAIEQSASAQVLIFKPAIHALSQWKATTTQQWIVTSYLDHPLGQVTAAYAAAFIDPDRQAVHGLLSHHAYHPHAMSQELTQTGPHFSVPKGVGFGFDQALAQLDWHVWS
jgi:o-succinylbenzoate synthase